MVKRITKTQLKILPGRVKGALRRKRVRVAVALLVVLLVTCALWAIVRSDESTSTDSHTVVTHSTDEPDETKPGPDYNWRGGPNDPKKVIISSASIDGFVQKVGVDQNQQIAVPGNVFVGGWFVDSVRPGEKGLSIIDGHINGRKQDGAIFKTLPQVKTDDKVVVEYGDGSRKTFTVIATHNVPLAEAQSILFSQDPTVSQQLNLITCVGKFDKKTNTYDKRFIVYAKLDT